MTTIIEPKTGTWEEIFEFPTISEEEKNIVDTALMLIAAWQTRGGLVSSNAILAKIVRAMTKSDGGDEDYAVDWKIIRRAIQALEHKPHSYRSRS